jgi:hypothetical protein
VALTRALLPGAILVVVIYLCKAHKDQTELVYHGAG